MSTPDTFCPLLVGTMFHTADFKQTLVMQRSHTSWLAASISPSAQHDIPRRAARGSQYVYCYKSQPFVHRGCHRIGQVRRIGCWIMSYVTHWNRILIIAEDTAGTGIKDWKGQLGYCDPFPAATSTLSHLLLHLNKLYLKSNQTLGGLSHFLGALAQIHQYCIALPWQTDIYGCALYLVNSKAHSMLPTACALST